MKHSPLNRSIFLALTISQIGAFLVFAFWRQFQFTSLVMDQALIVAILANVLSIFVFRRIASSTLPELSFDARSLFSSIAFLLALLSFCFNLLISTHVIGNIERSRSLYAIKWIAENPDNLESSFGIAIQAKLGLEARDAFLQRLHEHKVRKIVVEDKKHHLRLSFFGRTIYRFSNLISSIFNLRGWSEIQDLNL